MYGIMPKKFRECLNVELIFKEAGENNHEC